MDDSGALALWLAISAGGAAVTWYARWKREQVGAGLVVAYIVAFLLFHWLGAALYLLPWHSLYPLAVIEAGTRLSAYAMVAFALGSVVIAPWLMKALRLSRARVTAKRAQRRLIAVYMVIGLFCYLALTVAGRLPTVGALLGVGWNFLVAGLGLACWMALRERRFSALGWWLAVSACLPLFTLATQGFVSYGMGALLVVVTLFAGLIRPRLKAALVGLLLGYVWLSFYVSYMRDRPDIRAVVWGGESVEKRIEQIYQTVSNFEWFDAWDNEHLLRIDMRLNQNYLVGAAEMYLDSGREQYAHGATLWEAAIAVVPRALWPEKPVAAGSGELVSQYTGIQFQPGTSVGIGQVMEFYVNFGTAGIVGGFVLLGAVLTLVDSVAGQHLLAGNWRGFGLWYLPGLGLLQVGGSLVEVTGTAGAGLVMALAVSWFLQHGWGKDERRPIPVGRDRLSRPGTAGVPTRPDSSSLVG